MTVNQSHGGSSKQALSVIGGLDADVVTMNQAQTSTSWSNAVVVVDANWRKRLPHDATPTTVTVFPGAQGQSQGDQGLAGPRPRRSTSDRSQPKTSGNGRYTYLAAWGYALRKNANDEAAARAFVTKLFANVPVLDGGGRGATTTFTQRDTGDVPSRSRTRPLRSARTGRRQVRHRLSECEHRGVGAGGRRRQGGRQAWHARRGDGLSGIPVCAEGQAIIAKHNFRPRDETLLLAPRIASRRSRRSASKAILEAGKPCRRHTSRTARFTTRSYRGADDRVRCKTARSTRLRLVAGRDADLSVADRARALSAVFLKTASLDGAALWQAIASPRVLASYRLTFLASLAAAAVNFVFGFLLAWALVRYEFPGRKLVDALVDLPFALPTAVAGIALTALYAKNGWLGGFLEPLGLKVAFTRVGVFVALVFIGLPFVVRTLQPVLEDLDTEIEEAAASLGATGGIPCGGSSCRISTPRC